jgi:RNA polymerase sigma factor (sigma-70 family)
MSEGKATVYVVDDDPSMRESLRRLIGFSGYNVLVFESANSFLSQVEINHNSCLVLDVLLPDIDGMALQEILKERSGVTIPIIFISGHGDIPMSVKAMKNGAIDFLPKPFDGKDLIDAIARAVEQDKQNWDQELEKNRANALFETLTSREKEVLRWVVAGELNKQIASKMGITEKTVKVHRGRVMQKMKASSLAGLVRIAALTGILPEE